MTYDSSSSPDEQKTSSDEQKAGQSDRTHTVQPLQSREKQRRKNATWVKSN